MRNTDQKMTEVLSGMRKVAIVTGGARGLGEGIAMKMGELGYNVVVNYVSDRSEEKAETVLAHLKEKFGVEGLAVQADVSDYEQAKNLVETSIAHFGENLEVLANNAGIENNTRFIDLEPAKFRRVIDVNLVSYMNCAHVAIPHIITSGGGAIVNTASVGGLMGVVNQVDYCAAKSGVIGLTRALAAEYAADNIRVNAVAPGMIWTDMLRECNQEEVQVLKQAVPLGEIGEVEDIAEAVGYLVRAKYVTGQTLGPNGGLLMP